MGANDAASAVVVVFELARKLKAPGADRDLTYYFIFFDGEEAFRFDWRSWERRARRRPADNTYGSRHFVRKMEEEKYAVKALVLLDLVGDKDYSLVEYPTEFSPELIAIFKNASIETFGVEFLRADRRRTSSDDYVPFMAEKIPVIDLIDFQYGPLGNLDYWHTREDTLDKLEPAVARADRDDGPRGAARGREDGARRGSGSGGAAARQDRRLQRARDPTSSGTTTEPK